MRNRESGTKKRGPSSSNSSTSGSQLESDPVEKIHDLDMSEGASPSACCAVFVFPGSRARRYGLSRPLRSNYSRGCSRLAWSHCFWHGATYVDHAAIISRRICPAALRSLCLEREGFWCEW